MFNLECMDQFRYILGTLIRQECIRYIPVKLVWLFLDNEKTFKIIANENLFNCPKRRVIFV